MAPLAAQVGVCDARIGLGTLIDQLWVHTASKLTMFVELKKWETGTYSIATGHMRFPYQRVLNSAANQHQLQLAFGLAMFERTFAFRPAAASVIRLHTGGICVYPLAPWAAHPRVRHEAWRLMHAFLKPIIVTALGGARRESDGESGEISEALTFAPHNNAHEPAAPDGEDMTDEGEVRSESSYHLLPLPPVSIESSVVEVRNARRPAAAPIEGRNLKRQKRSEGMVPLVRGHQEAYAFNAVRSIMSHTF